MRLITWNWHSGPLTARLEDLAAHSPDVVFLQECHPRAALPSPCPAIIREINSRKAIALLSLSDAYRIEAIAPALQGGKATVAAAVTGPVEFVVLGIWSKGPHYVHDVLEAIEAHRNLLSPTAAVVMGDMNSGTRLDGKRTPNKWHTRIVDAMADLGLVSAYHTYHGIAHGHERHATYYHQRNAAQAWHIDFCFVPEGWCERLTGARVIGGTKWRAKSDHLPLCIDLRF